jgi:integrase
MLIQDWLRKLELAPKTKGGIKALMHRLFEKAMLWEFLPMQRNPVELVEVKGITKRTKKPIILTPKQYELILESIPNEPYKTMVVVGICLGLRVSEILALKWADVDFKHLTMRVSRKIVNGRVSKVKTEYSEDDLPLDPAFAERLLSWYRNCPKTESGWVFPNPNSMKPFWASEVQKDYLVPAGKKAGIMNLGWHAFRHTYRSLLDAAGAPIGVQQKLMRHAQGKRGFLAVFALGRKCGVE